MPTLLKFFCLFKAAILSASVLNCGSSVSAMVRMSDWCDVFVCFLYPSVWLVPIAQVDNEEEMLVLGKLWLDEVARFELSEQVKRTNGRLSLEPQMYCKKLNKKESNAKTDNKSNKFPLFCFLQLPTHHQRATRKRAVLDDAKQTVKIVGEN